LLKLFVALANPHIRKNLLSFSTFAMYVSESLPLVILITYITVFNYTSQCTTYGNGVCEEAMERWGISLSVIWRLSMVTYPFLIGFSG